MAANLITPDHKSPFPSAREHIPGKPTIDHNYLSVWQQYGGGFANLLNGNPPFQKRVVLESGDFIVRTAKDFIDLDLMLQIRFINYANLEPLPWIHPYNPRAELKSHMNREVPDEYEASSTSLILEHKGIAIGTIRIIPEDRGIPAIDSYGAHTLEQLLPNRFFLEPSRFCVLQPYQKTLAMPLLMAAMYQLALEKASSLNNFKGSNLQNHNPEDRVAFVFESKPGDMVKLYTKLGAKATGITALHRVGETLELLVWPLENTSKVIRKRVEKSVVVPASEDRVSLDKYVSASWQGAPVLI